MLKDAQACEQLPADVLGLVCVDNQAGMFFQPSQQFGNVRIELCVICNVSQVVLLIEGAQARRICRALG
jgi:hypothetical protein